MSQQEYFAIAVCEIYQIDKGKAYSSGRFSITIAIQTVYLFFETHYNTCGSREYNINCFHKTLCRLYLI